MSRRIPWVLAFPGAAALAALAAASGVPAAEGGHGAGPGAVFRERCASCHAVPDPALRTDRAWLDQVRRTA